MTRQRKVLAVGIAACGIVATFAYYAQRPYSWQLDHTCSDTGTVLADSVFMRAAFEYQSGEVSPGLSRTGEVLASTRYASSSDEFEAQFPDCCHVYLGPPADIITPPSWWMHVTNRFPKAVLVNIEYKYKYRGRIEYRTLSQIVMLDSCANIIERSKY